MINQEQLNKMNEDTVKKEIDSRRQLMDQMVGTLYPSILADELVQLYEKQYEQRFSKSGPKNC